MELATSPRCEQTATSSSSLTGPWRRANLRNVFCKRIPYGIYHHYQILSHLLPMSAVRITYRVILSLIPGALPGSTVKTFCGSAQIKQIRSTDAVHIARPINWKLANDSTATLYLAPEAVQLTQTAGFHEGDEVMTVYGQGFIESKREIQGDYVVKLRQWALAQGQSPTCYLQPSSLVKIPGFSVGAVAKTVWGLVRVLGIRRDGTHVCTAVHWSLANDTAPTCYLAPEAFALLSLKP